MKTTVSLDTLYKRNFSKMVSGLIRTIGIKEIETAEDIVQETFMAAQQDWQNEYPQHPEAWLFKVCKNIALNSIRDKKETSLDVTVDVADSTPGLSHDQDDTLSILLACTHPRFSPKQQVIFALRYAAGFRVDQIATVLGAPYETVIKTLQRIRAILKNENIKLQFDQQNVSFSTRLILVKILYLIFNEGYKTSHGKSILNITLCEDALSMVQAMVSNTQLTIPDAHALYALMLFNLSRFDARFDKKGNIVDLESQDRSKWNRDMIALATHHLAKGKTANPSSYQIEAMIAYLHCEAPSFERTDWPKIVGLYSRLNKINSSAFVELNWAIAQYYAGEYLAALDHLHQLGKIAFINNYYLFHVAMGKVLSEADPKAARDHFYKAVDLASHQAEKNYIHGIIYTLEARS